MHEKIFWMFALKKYGAYYAWKKIYIGCSAAKNAWYALFMKKFVLDVLLLKKQGAHYS